MKKRFLFMAILCGIGTIIIDVLITFYLLGWIPITSKYRLITLVQAFGCAIGMFILMIFLHIDEKLKVKKGGVFKNPRSETDGD